MTAAVARLGATGLVGTVVDCVGGLVDVETCHGRLRVSLGGAMLARVAADRGARPSPGDQVALTRWPDGPVTLDRLLARGAATDGVVVPLRRP